MDKTAQGCYGALGVSRPGALPGMGLYADEGESPRDRNPHQKNGRIYPDRTVLDINEVSCEGLGCVTRDRQKVGRHIPGCGHDYHPAD